MPKSRFAKLLLPLLLLALLGETAWFAPWETAATQPDRRLPPLPLAAVDPLGAHTFLEREVDRFKKDKTAEMLQASGVGWIRQEFPWAELEFRKGYFFDDKNNKSAWVKFDEIVSRAETSSIGIIARLDRTPLWAARKDSTGTNAPPANLKDFGDFVAAFVGHYKGRIHFLQIWNEPNLQVEWVQNQPVNAADYVALLKEAATRARAVDPDIVILSAPLAPTNENWHETPNQTHNLRETVYLAEMYAAGAASYFDILAANAFGYSSPPEEDPAPDRYNFRRLELLRAVMEAHGDANKAVWITEYAWNAPDPNAVKPGDILWGQVSLEQQADYTVRGIRYGREHWPWVGVFAIWYFRQVGDIAATDATYYFAMVTPDFVPRPLYTAVQAEAARLAVAGPGNHSALSASVQTGPGWSLHLVRGTGDEPAYPLMVTREASATLQITFQGTDLDLQFAPGATGAAAGRFYITVDGDPNKAAAGLPRDPSGPYVESEAGPPTGGGGGHEAAPLLAPRRVTVVSGLGNQTVPGVHRVELRAVGSGAALAGFQVRSERSYLAFGALTTLLLAALVGDGLWLRRARRVNT